MYKVVFEYADGRKGVCRENAKIRLFDTEQEAADFAANLNGQIEEELKPFPPVWSVEKAGNGDEASKYDVVYAIVKNHSNFQLEVVYAPVYSVTNRTIVLEKERTAFVSDRYEFPKSEWGKSIFATSKEAEAALARMKG